MIKVGNRKYLYIWISTYLGKISNLGDFDSAGLFTQKQMVRLLNGAALEVEYYVCLRNFGDAVETI